MEPRFYMTYGRDWPKEIVPWVEANDVPLLTNAINRWSEAKEDWLPMWEYDTPHTIDAGGFNVMLSWIQDHHHEYLHPQSLADADISRSDVRAELETNAPFYPWTVKQYHEWLQRHSDEFEWATVMDYACENRFDPAVSVQKRRELTLETTLEHFALEPEYDLLPVLQGQTADQYVEFYDWLVDHGIEPEFVGLGTVCRLASQSKIVDLEREVRRRLPVKRIHGFGVKINAFGMGAGFESADSNAWVYAGSNGSIYVDVGDSLRRVPSDDDCTRKVESFKNYYAYVTRLQRGESAIDGYPEFDKQTPDEEITEELEKREY